jgi:cytochrome P450
LSGVYLPEGTIVTSSVVTLHRDENVFPNSDHFSPERWIEPDEQTFKIRDAQLIPFGYGGRICLGKALATMEIKLLIARLYLKYETVMTESSSEGSMKQCSTHDAVPWALKCVVRFLSANKAVARCP